MTAIVKPSVASLVKSQLPEFVREDYQTFVAFVEAYYEYIQNNELDLKTIRDIDTTLESFIRYFKSELAPNLPYSSVDTRFLLKNMKSQYLAKGSESSIKLLFKILYDKEVSVAYPSTQVLRASDGKWYIAKSLKLATTDERFLNINNYRLFGESTKSIATVETSVKSQNKIEIFISNIERLFESGETVKIVDANRQDVIIDGSTLTAVLVGQISQININPNNRGLFYDVGDPVVVYGGLNQTISNPVGATAQVGSVSSGSIKSISVISGGFDPTLPSPPYSGVTPGSNYNVYPPAAVTALWWVSGSPFMPKPY